MLLNRPHVLPKGRYKMPRKEPNETLQKDPLNKTVRLGRWVALGHSKTTPRPPDHDGAARAEDTTLQSVSHQPRSAHHLHFPKAGCASVWADRLLTAGGHQPEAPVWWSMQER